jgi:putative hydrolase of the HAD superfamily
MIKHISFDLWMTLIRSNPDFRKKRAEIIAKKFNPGNKNVEEIIQLIIDTDKNCDRYNESRNTKIPAVKMYSAILKKMGIPSVAIQHNADLLMNISNELFLEYSPLLLNSHIPDTLKTLKDSGLNLSIGSNTGFIEGNILKSLLDKLNILHYFSFLIFSDEMKMSKPSARFYLRIWENTTFHKSEILHVGDNPINDYQGAVDFGFNALLLTDTNYSFDDIRTKL